MCKPDPIMTSPVRISYLLLAVLLGLAAWLHMGAFLLAAFFGYLVLETACIRGRKTLAVLLYLLVIALLGAGLIYFSGLAYRTLPKIAATSIPAMASFAQKNGIDLPFSDFESLKDAALDSAEKGLATLGLFARVASFQFVLLLAGLVVAASVFFNPSWTVSRISHAPSVENLYTATTRELSARVRLLYRSFARVIGAQLIISVINTVLTAIFLLSLGFPYAVLLMVLVLLCGLMPIVGNLMSNAVIVGVAFTISPRMGLIALIFLVAIHKLEYFLNSKIVGQRIDSPMWLTLIGLIVGEKLMGISGMILAPVLLHYIKIESSAYPRQAYPRQDELLPPSGS